MPNALYSPFLSRLNPIKDVDLVGATHSFIWWGALSGKRGSDTMRVEMTFLWMSELNRSERVDGSKFDFIADWLDPTDKYINKLASVLFRQSGSF
jgi:hypothetical protein